MPRTGRPPVGLLLMLVLAACADPGVPTAPGAPMTVSPDLTPSAEPSPGPAELTVKVRDGEGAQQTWQLTCDPAGGDHPDPAGACRALAQHGGTALPPVAKDMMCTEIYGGPETATVTGTWRSQPVRSSFSRTNGCEIARWDQLQALLRVAGR